jgi:hypothetical protein
MQKLTMGSSTRQSRFRNRVLGLPQLSPRLLHNVIVGAWHSREKTSRKMRIARRNLVAALEHPLLYNDVRQLERMKRLGYLLRDRSVAVVGNAVSLLDASHGSQIDGHDEVVRFNFGFVESAASQGTKNTIHCLACDLSREKIIAAWPDAKIVFVSPLRYHMAEDLRSETAYDACVPIGDWENLVAELGGHRPSAGLIILSFLKSAGCSRISLYGFDWKRTKSFYHAEKRADWHSGEAERLLLLRWMQDSPGLIDASACPMD